jgi:hypothetical protein
VLLLWPPVDEGFATRSTWKRERVSVCLCVCVCEREREAHIHTHTERVCVCVRARVSECAKRRQAELHPPSTVSSTVLVIPPEILTGPTFAGIYLKVNILAAHNMFGS